MLMLGLLPHLAHVQRPGPLRDRFGQPVEAETNRTEGVTLRCRLEPAAGKVHATEKLRSVGEDRYTVYFAGSADVRPGDRIHEILDPEGGVLAERLHVERVRGWSGFGGLQHHLEVLCLGGR